jgi:hypothetical protein
MAFELTDDGTLDTVVRCTECGVELRYKYDSSDADTVDPDDNGDAYDAFVAWAIEDAEQVHVCESEDAEPTEPQEDDITTTDHLEFYASGKLVLNASRNTEGKWYARNSDGSPFDIRADSYEDALRQYMNHVAYWPNVWFISDHGNAHLITL